MEKSWNFSPEHVKKHLLMPYLQHASLPHYDQWCYWSIIPGHEGKIPNSARYPIPTRYSLSCRQSWGSSGGNLQLICPPLSKTQPASAVVAEKKNLRMATRHSPLLLTRSTEHTEAKVILLRSYHTPYTTNCLLKGRIVLPLMGSLFSHQFVNIKVRLMTNNPS